MMGAIGTYNRHREETSAGPVIHVEMPHDTGRTLCGYAFEGSCVEGEGDSGTVPVMRGKINCADCLLLIIYCQAIPRRILLDLTKKDQAEKMRHVTR